MPDIVSVVDDAIGIAETEYDAQGFFAVVDESIGIADTEYAWLGLVAVVDEAIGIAESEYDYLGLVVVVDDSIGIVETIYSIGVDLPLLAVNYPTSLSVSWNTVLGLVVLDIPALEAAHVVGDHLDGPPRGGHHGWPGPGQGGEEQGEE